MDPRPSPISENAGVTVAVWNCTVVVTRCARPDEDVPGLAAAPLLSSCWQLDAAPCVETDCPTWPRPVIHTQKCHSNNTGGHSSLRVLSSLQVIIRLKERLNTEYWIHFTAHFGGVHTFGYNSAEREPIWMTSGALWVHCRG